MAARIETVPKFDLSEQEVESLEQELEDDHAIFSPFFNAENREKKSSSTSRVCFLTCLEKRPKLLYCTCSELTPIWFEPRNPFFHKAAGLIRLSLSALLSKLMLGLEKPINQARLTCIPQFVIALVNAQTCNLNTFALKFKSKAGVPSQYARL